MLKQKSDKQLRLEYVQYECIKSELKGDYNKKITQVNKQLQKRALFDPSYMLINSLASYEDAPKANSKQLKDTELQKVNLIAKHIA